MPPYFLSIKPEIIIRTSLIVGFPGESEEDFSMLVDFVERYEFDRLGAFTYSREDDTPAAKFRQQIPKRVKQKRYNTIMGLQKQINFDKNNERLNRIYDTIVEGVAEDGIFYFGRTYAEAPEIDGAVYFTSCEPLEAGQIVKIKILDVSHYDLIGEVLNESAQ